ncbi:hypothetical protein SARC_09886, partial [Sphaeroforma arctica JP610]
AQLQQRLAAIRQRQAQALNATTPPTSSEACSTANAPTTTTKHKPNLSTWDDAPKVIAKAPRIDVRLPTDTQPPNKAGGDRQSRAPVRIRPKKKTIVGVKISGRAKAMAGACKLASNVRVNGTASAKSGCSSNDKPKVKRRRQEVGADTVVARQTRLRSRSRESEVAQHTAERERERTTEVGSGAKQRMTIVSSKGVVADMGPNLIPNFPGERLEEREHNLIQQGVGGDEESAEQERTTAATDRNDGPTDTVVNESRQNDGGDSKTMLKQPRVCRRRTVKHVARTPHSTSTRTQIHPTHTRTQPTPNIQVMGEDGAPGLVNGVYTQKDSQVKMAEGSSSIATSKRSDLDRREQCSITQKGRAQSLYLRNSRKRPFESDSDEEVDNGIAENELDTCGDGEFMSRCRGACGGSSGGTSGMGSECIDFYSKERQTHTKGEGLKSRSGSKERGKLREKSGEGGSSGRYAMERDSAGGRSSDTERANTAEQNSWQLPLAEGREAGLFTQAFAANAGDDEKENESSEWVQGDTHTRTAGTSKCITGDKETDTAAGILTASRRHRNRSPVKRYRRKVVGVAGEVLLQSPLAPTASIRKHERSDVSGDSGGVVSALEANGGRRTNEDKALQPNELIIGFGRTGTSVQTLSKACPLTDIRPVPEAVRQNRTKLTPRVHTSTKISTKPRPATKPRRKHSISLQRAQWQMPVQRRENGYISQDSSSEGTDTSTAPDTSTAMATATTTDSEICSASQSASDWEKATGKHTNAHVYKHKHTRYNKSSAPQTRRIRRRNSRRNDIDGKTRQSRLTARQRKATELERLYAHRFIWPPPQYTDLVKANFTLPMEMVAREWPEWQQQKKLARLRRVSGSDADSSMGVVVSTSKMHGSGSGGRNGDTMQCGGRQSRATGIPKNMGARVQANGRDLSEATPESTRSRTTPVGVSGGGHAHARYGASHGEATDIDTQSVKGSGDDRGSSSDNNSDTGCRNKVSPPNRQSFGSGEGGQLSASEAMEMETKMELHNTAEEQRVYAVEYTSEESDAPTRTRVGRKVGILLSQSSQANDHSGHSVGVREPETVVHKDSVVPDTAMDISDLAIYNKSAAQMSSGESDEPMRGHAHRKRSRTLRKSSGSAVVRMGAASCRSPCGNSRRPKGHRKANRGNSRAEKKYRNRVAAGCGYASGPVESDRSDLEDTGIREHRMVATASDTQTLHTRKGEAVHVHDKGSPRKGESRRVYKRILEESSGLSSAASDSDDDDVVVYRRPLVKPALGTTGGKDGVTRANAMEGEMPGTEDVANAGTGSGERVVDTTAPVLTESTVRLSALRSVPKVDVNARGSVHGSSEDRYGTSSSEKESDNDSVVVYRKSTKEPNVTSESVEDYVSNHTTKRDRTNRSEKWVGDMANVSLKWDRPNQNQKVDSPGSKVQGPEESLSLNTLSLTHPHSPQQIMPCTSPAHTQQMLSQTCPPGPAGQYKKHTSSQTPPQTSTQPSVHSWSLPASVSAAASAARCSADSGSPSLLRSISTLPLPAKTIASLNGPCGSVSVSDTDGVGEATVRTQSSTKGKLLRYDSERPQRELQANRNSADMLQSEGIPSESASEMLQDSPTHTPTQSVCGSTNASLARELLGTYNPSRVHGVVLGQDLNESKSESPESVTLKIGYEITSPELSLSNRGSDTKLANTGQSAEERTANVEGFSAASLDESADGCSKVRNHGARHWHADVGQGAEGIAMDDEATTVITWTVHSLTISDTLLNRTCTIPISCIRVSAAAVLPHTCSGTYMYTAVVVGMCENGGGAQLFLYHMAHAEEPCLKNEKSTGQSRAHAEVGGHTRASTTPRTPVEDAVGRQPGSAELSDPRDPAKFGNKLKIDSLLLHRAEGADSVCALAVTGERSVAYAVTCRGDSGGSVYHVEWGSELRGQSDSAGSCPTDELVSNSVCAKGLDTRGRSETYKPLGTEKHAMDTECGSEVCGVTSGPHSSDQKDVCKASACRDVMNEEGLNCRADRGLVKEEESSRSVGGATQDMMAVSVTELELPEDCLSVHSLRLAEVDAALCRSKALCAPTYVSTVHGIDRSHTAGTPNLGTERPHPEPEIIDIGYGGLESGGEVPNNGTAKPHYHYGTDIQSRMGSPGAPDGAVGRVPDVKVGGREAATETTCTHTDDTQATEKTNTHTEDAQATQKHARLGTSFHSCDHDSGAVHTSELNDGVCDTATDGCGGRVLCGVDRNHHIVLWHLSSGLRVADMQIAVAPTRSAEDGRVVPNFYECVQAYVLSDNAEVGEYWVGMLVVDRTHRTEALKMKERAGVHKTVVKDIAIHAHGIQTYTPHAHEHLHENLAQAQETRDRGVSSQSMGVADSPCAPVARFIRVCLSSDGVSADVYREYHLPTHSQMERSSAVQCHAHIHGDTHACVQRDTGTLVQTDAQSNLKNERLMSSTQQGGVDKHFQTPLASSSRQSCVYERSQIPLSMHKHSETECPVHGEGEAQTPLSIHKHSEKGRPVHGQGEAAPWLPVLSVALDNGFVCTWDVLVNGHVLQVLPPHSAIHVRPRVCSPRHTGTRIDAQMYTESQTRLHTQSQTHQVLTNGVDIRDGSLVRGSREYTYDDNDSKDNRSRVIDSTNMTNIKTDDTSSVGMAIKNQGGTKHSEGSSLKAANTFMYTPARTPNGLVQSMATLGKRTLHTPVRAYSNTSEDTGETQTEQRGRRSLSTTTAGKDAVHSEEFSPDVFARPFGVPNFSQTPHSRTQEPVFTNRRANTDRETPVLFIGTNQMDANVSQPMMNGHVDAEADQIRGESPEPQEDIEDVAGVFAISRGMYYAVVDTLGRAELYEFRRS